MAGAVLQVKTTRGAMKVSAAEIRHAFVNNTQLLGFKEERDSPYDAGAADRSGPSFRVPGSKRHRPPFGPLMFADANPQGFYELTYFLLVRLDEDHYAQLFDTCWPLYDTRQIRAFRKIVLGELREFEKLGYIPGG